MCKAARRLAHGPEISLIIDQKECERGTYASGRGATSCVPANSGFFVPDEGATGQDECEQSVSCSDCSAGGFSGSGATQCEICGPGRYTDETGLASCGLADAGYFVDPDDPSVEKPCPPGTFSGSGSIGCTPCAPGTYVGGPRRHLA